MGLSVQDGDGGRDGTGGPDDPFQLDGDPEVAGRGSPCAMIVDSRATTGSPPARAARTSAERTGS